MDWLSALESSEGHIREGLRLDQPWVWNKFVRFISASKMIFFCLFLHSLFKWLSFGF